MRTTGFLAAAILLAAAGSGPARADVNRGADLYDENCADCHSLAKPLKNKKGPGLVGVVGRTAASVPDFNYSDALRAAKLAWTPDQLDAYLRAPKTLVPGGKMKFDGMDKADERRDLIEFLATQR
ncbi:c-type cytochrome [Solimonas flava]|uniref:c-type cytochrome n=1 Tax=Solimonas flava TaxID=415849 RepID=UPI0004270BA1|nr:c-type cytochrome [Solimonas flava]